MENLTVILRTCDSINAFSGNRPRDFGSKKDVIRKCCKSIRDSIDYFIDNGGSCNFVIVDDHSSEDTISFLNSLNPTSLVKLAESGNGVSFEKCVDLAIGSEGLVFLVEDDYLLDKTCILSMVKSYSKIKSDLNLEPCIHPSDYPDRYKLLYPSFVSLGFDRHYRTIKHTTCTFMYHSSVFKEFEKELKEFKKYGIDPSINEDNTINLVYKKYFCFSPIPSLAEHYQYFDTLSPYFKE